MFGDSEYTWSDFTYDQAYQTLDLRNDVKETTVKLAQKFNLNELLVYDVESDYYDALSYGEVQRLAEQSELDILLYAIKKIYHIDVNELKPDDLRKNIFFKSLDKKLYNVYSNILNKFCNKLNTMNNINYYNDNHDLFVYDYTNEENLDDEYIDDEYIDDGNHETDDEDDDNSLIYSDEEDL